MAVVNARVLQRGVAYIDLSKVVCWYPAVGGGIQVKIRNRAPYVVDIPSAEVSAFESAMQAWVSSIVGTGGMDGTYGGGAVVYYLRVRGQPVTVRGQNITIRGAGATLSPSIYGQTTTVYGQAVSIYGQ